MRPLTANQFLKLQELSVNPLISNIDPEIIGGMVARIRITSAIGADWNKVDAAIEKTLRGDFPDYEYMGQPAVYTSPTDGLEHELYFINFEGETLISLIMRKKEDSAKTEPTKE